MKHQENSVAGGARASTEYYLANTQRIAVLARTRLLRFVTHLTQTRFGAKHPFATEFAVRHAVAYRNSPSEGSAAMSIASEGTA